jgi:hypothetical protein
MKITKALGPLLLLAAWCLGGCNVKEAKAHVAGLQKTGVDATFVSCVQNDTAPGDGYLACTITVAGEPETIDCAGEALVVENHGCKVYTAKMNNTTIVTGGGSSSSTRAR